MYQADYKARLERIPDVREELGSRYAHDLVGVVLIIIRFCWRNQFISTERKAVANMLALE